MLVREGRGEGVGGGGGGGGGMGGGGGGKEGGGDGVRDVVFNRGETVSAPAVQDASWLGYSCRTVILRG